MKRQRQGHEQTASRLSECLEVLGLLAFCSFALLNLLMSACDSSSQSEELFRSIQMAVAIMIPIEVMVISYVGVFHAYDNYSASSLIQ